MAEITADTSSYPKPAGAVPAKSFLETAGQFQQLERANVGLQKEKLELINTNYARLLAELNSLPPEATADDMRRVATNAVKLKLITPEMAGQFISGIPTDPTKIRAYRDEIVAKALDTQAAINWNYGPAGYQTNQQQITPVRTPGRTAAPIPTAAPIQIQEPPGTPSVVTDPNNPLYGSPTTRGPQNPQVPAGRIPVQGGLPGQFNPNAPMRPNVVPTTREQPRLPVAPPVVYGDGSTNQTPAQTVAERFQPAGTPSGMPPLFEEGRKQYVEDQNLATQKLTALKPAIKALKMLPGLQSGPGTEAWNTAVAFLKANNVIPTQTPNDPTAIRQEVNKYFSEYVSGRGNRSDADLAQSEERSPNAKVQISPALINLTRNAVARDLIEASRAGSFRDKDFTKYGEHRSKHPTQMDEKAFEFSFLPKDEQYKIYTDMKNKALKGNAGAVRFLRTLMEARRQNLVDLD